MPLTNIEIASHIADDNNVTWVSAEELLVDAMESCVDGRGELQAAEQVESRLLDREQEAPTAIGLVGNSVKRLC